MMEEKNILTTIWGFLSNRLLFLTIGICALFYILAAELFQLQIVEGQTHSKDLSATIARGISIAPQRGNIYDRYGRPLAINQFAYSVTIDPSISMEDNEINAVIYNLVALIEKNGEDYIDELPLSAEEPYEFVFYDNEEKTKQINWLINQMEIVKIVNKNTEAANEKAFNMTGDEAFELLREKFKIDESISNDYARKIISIRAKLWLIRFYSFNPITIASNVGLDTVTHIEEDAVKYKSINIETEAVRYYPEGEYLAHIVGYIGNTNADEMKSLKEDGFSDSEIPSMVGKTGIEVAFEENLRGSYGKQTVIVNYQGRKVSEIEDSRIDPVQGDKIFLTIDAAFHRECYDLLEDMLVEVIINKLATTNEKATKLTPTEILASLVAANHLNAKDIFESEYASASYALKEYVLSVDPQISADTRDGRLNINALISEGIEDGQISLSNVLITLWEQGIITGDEYYIERIRNGWISPTQVLIDKLTEREITPAMTNVDPSTGSLIVVDLATGDILAAPSYPSYDTNEFITNFNSAYMKLYDDPTTPMYNRAFRENRPPGSTFKMISAVAGLESGTISRYTKIYDEVKFTKAGKPEPECWNKSGHGHVNVVEALAVSCNYFFFETAYNMGNQKAGNKLESIRTMNKYMSLFGLDEPTGVEIGESNKALGKSELNMATPALKMKIEGTEWMDGNSSHVAIGQGFNDYTSTVMGRYISIIANQGEKYDLHLLNRIVTDDEILEYVPRRSNIGSEISTETWNMLHEGMRQTVTTGTAKNIFSGFPIEVAGKTGTAEQMKSRPEHTTFGGFAPYDEPEIAVYVMLPFSDTKTTASPATQLARNVIAAYFKLDGPIEEPDEVNVIAR